MLVLELIISIAVKLSFLVTMNQTSVPIKESFDQDLLYEF